MVALEVLFYRSQTDQVVAQTTDIRFIAQSC